MLNLTIYSIGYYMKNVHPLLIICMSKKVQQNRPYVSCPDCQNLPLVERFTISHKGASEVVLYLIRIMTEGVWAMAPIILHTQMTHRKVRKACWQPGLGHFPGKATASSLALEMHAQLVRF